MDSPTQLESCQIETSLTVPEIPSERAASGSPPAWAVAAVLAISVGAIYGRAVNVPLVFDDRDSITTNGSIVSLWPLIGTAERPGPLNPPPDIPTSGRPLVNFSLALNYWMGGLDPAGYHIVNMLIHVSSALLVWAIVRRTLRLPCFATRFETSAGWLALVVAILWAMHPLQTEAVIYATQRTELMVAFFYLATLHCSLRYWSELPLPFREEPGEGSFIRGAWLTLAIFACLAGMASKEVMVSAPVIVLLFERTFVAGSLKAALRNSWPLYAGLASTWLLLLVLLGGAPRSESAGFGLGVSAFEWWLTQAKVLLIYLKLVFWPWPLLFHYELPYLTTFADAWIYVVPVLLLGVITLVLLRRNLPIGFVGTWVFAILSPTLLVPIVLEMAAERRMYLPLVAIIALFVVLGYRLAVAAENRWRNARRVAVRNVAIVMTGAFTLLLAIGLGLVSAKRLVAYEDEMSLWREVLEHQPNNTMAHDNLGSLLIKAGRPAEAMDEYRAALAIKPMLHFGPNSYGVALMHLGRYDESIEYFEKALRLKPDYAEAYENLGKALSQIGRYSEAIAYIERSLQLKPNTATAHEALGVALAGNGQVPDAIVHLRRAIEMDPDFASARINLAKILDTTGDNAEAIAHLRHALRLLPDHADIHNRLGVSFGKTGRTNEAIEHFQAALRLDPKFAQAYSNLALALAFSNRSDEAIAMSERAIEIARTTGQAEVAARAEEWLQHYRSDLRRDEQAKTQ